MKYWAALMACMLLGCGDDAGDAGQMESFVTVSADAAMPDGAMAELDAGTMTDQGPVYRPDAPKETHGDEEDGGAPEAAPGCFSGGEAMTSMAAVSSGACGAPYVLDLSRALPGYVYSHETGSAPANTHASGLGTCASHTGRDFVYNIRIPAGTDLEVSVDPVEGGDPILLVQAETDVICSGPEPTQCVDHGSKGDCEYLRIEAADGQFDGDAIQLIVAETHESDTSYTVQLRVAAP